MIVFLQKKIDFSMKATLPVSWFDTNFNFSNMVRENIYMLSISGKENWS